MALPTYGLLGAGSAMLQAPPGAGIGPTVGSGLAGFLSGVPADVSSERTARTRKTLDDVAAQWRAGAQQLAANHAIPISYLSRVATAESNNRNVPQAINDTGSAFGPFQFTEGTWADQIARHPELGLTPQDRFNPAAQGRVAVTFTRDNRDQMRDALGREPTAGDLLLAHRFGAVGAISLLNTPRNQSVAKALPAAVAANPQWQQLTVGQILANTQRAAGQSTAEAAPRGGGGLLGSTPTPSTVSSTEGLAALFGGVPLAPAGASFQDMTPEFRNILATALSDPTLGPMALQAIIQAGLSGGGGRGGGALKPTDEITNALAAGYRPGTPEWDRVVGKAPQPAALEAPKPTEIMKEAAALYPDNPAAQRKFIEDYRAKTGGVSVEIKNPLQPTSPNPVVQDEFKRVMETGSSANAVLAEITKARQALKNLPTGAGREYQVKAQAWMKSLGLDPNLIGPDITTPGQLLTAISIPMALRVRLSGTGQMSDREQALYQAATIGLEKTPEANEFILDDAEANAKRAQEERKFATQFVKQRGGVDIDLPAALDEWRATHPVYNEAFYKKWEPKLQAPPQTPTTAAPQAGPPTISDQKAYDALPSGTTYQSGGKLYRKP